MKNFFQKGKIFLLTGILSFLVLILIGCVTVSSDWVEPKGSNSVLYVSRHDTFASVGYIVSFYLNDQKIADIGDQQYIIIHLKPGTYNAEFRFFTSGGEQTKSKSWTGSLESAVLHEAVANFFFGWQSTARFNKINTKIGVLKANFQEEIDLTETMDPK